MIRPLADADAVEAERLVNQVAGSRLKARLDPMIDVLTLPGSGAWQDRRFALDAVKSQGGRVTDEAPPRPGSRGRTVAFVHPKGALGAFIELVQE